ncbi:hypothetical protein ABPG72_003795 [Tetrahymena utriculariae]
MDFGYSSDEDHIQVKQTNNQEEEERKNDELALKQAQNEQIDSTGASKQQSKYNKLNDQLQIMLKKHNIDIQKLPTRICNVKIQIEELIKKNQQSQVPAMKKTLEELEQIQAIYDEINQFVGIQHTKESDFERIKDSKILSQGQKNELNQQQNQNTQGSESIPQEENVQNFDLEEINQIISQMALSSEKLLNQMIKDLNYYLQASNDQGKQQLQDLLLEIENRLKVEELINKEIEACLLKIKSHLTSNNYKKAIFETESLLKKIRPLNIYELRKLILEAKKASDFVKDQEILLLLGQTGTGKSTTIHFLSGSKMVQLKNQVAQGIYLTYVGPDPNQIKNEELKKVKIGFRHKSETRYITPIYVNKRDIGINQDGSCILCDSAGFEDSNGAEVDISNGIGIVEAVKNCKSVRPVILVSSVSVGEKGQGIKELANILVGLVNNIQDYLSSFSYVFTKYPADLDIHASLISIRESLNQDESSNVDFISLFDDMIEQTECNNLKIDPLKDKPSKIMKQLLKQKPINNPKNVFQFSITEASKNILLEQVRINQLCIISASKRQEYQLVQQKLDDLAYLIDILNQDFTKQIYQESINFVKQDLNKSYEDTVEQLKRCIKNSNKLDADDLSEFKQLVSRFQKAEKLRNVHLGNDVVQTSSLIQALKEAVENMSKSFSDVSDINSSEAINNLDNIKLISTHFPEIQHQYSQLCLQITQKIQNIAASCQEALEIKDFSKLAYILSQIKQYSNIYQNHLNEQVTIAYFHKSVESFTIFMNKIYNEADQVLKKNKRSDEDIKQLNSTVCTIESAEQTLELKQHILAEIENIKKSKQNLIQKAIQQFDTYNKKIEQLLKEYHDNSLIQVQELFFEMDQIKKIKGLDYHTGEAYHKTVQEIVGLMQQKIREVEQNLSDFRLDKRKVDYDKIMRCINWLKQMQWMNGIKSGTYDSTIKSISEELVKYCNSQILEKLIDLDLNLNHPENIQIGSDLITEIESMRSFESHNSKLVDVRNLANQKFKSSPQKIFDSINCQFSLSGSDTEQFNQNKLQTKLDGKYLELLLTYIAACHKSRWLRDDAYRSKLIITQFLQQYGETQQQEMRESFQNIKSVTQDEIKTVTGNACKLSLILKNLQELEIYPETFELIKGQYLLQEWKNTLHQYYIELNDEMSNSCISSQLLSLKICISRALASVDFILGENNMFLNNYKQFQVAVTHEFREIHKKILQFIEKNDFQSVQVEITSIDENPINEKAFNQIKQQINQQINYLLEEAKKTIVTLGSNLEKATILSIVENLNKINSAKKYLSSLQGILDLKNFAHIEEEIEQIKKTIGEKIYKNLESIQALIKRGDFFEAEQKKEHINQIQHILGFYAQDNKMMNEFEKVQNDLVQSIETTLQSYYNEDSDFVLHPPRQIFEQLRKLSGNNLKYEECYRLLQQKVINKVRNAIKDYQDSCPDEKNINAIKVENFLNCLPDELKLMLSNEFNNQKSLFQQKEEGYEISFKRVSESNNLEQKKKYLDKCNKDQMIYFQDKISRQILTEAKQLKQQFKDLLAETNINQAILQLNELVQIKNIFGRDISGVEAIIKEVKDIIKTQILKNLKYLKAIDSVEDTELFEREYDKLITFLISFNDTFKENQEILSKEIYQNIDEVFLNMQHFLITNQSNFDKSLTEKQIYQIEKCLQPLKRWDKFIRKIKSNLDEFSSLDQNQEWLKSLNQIVVNCYPYNKSTQKVQLMLENEKKEFLAFSFCKELEDKRNSYYARLNQTLKMMKEVQSIKGNLIDTQFDLESYQKDCLIHVLGNINNGLESIERILQQEDQLQRNQFDIFNFNYENIYSISKNIKIQEADLPEFVKFAEDLIKKKIKTLSDKVVSGENINIAVDNLIQMKLFSENILSFQVYIDKAIDESLNSYLNKDKTNRGKKICELAMHLQKEELGLGETIITDHSCFKGQSLSLFNQSTKKHGIDYILKYIDGDNIDKNRIKELHEQIKKQFEELVKNNLIILQKKTKSYKEIIQDLVSKIKSFSKGVKHKNGKITWDYQIKEMIPSMVAYIFVLYTLMNSEYYQELNEKEYDSDYLFQPHSGQIVSIFRLFGLGYGDARQEKLQNNLIQIGTGEGKSITLAVTSSIFALLGIDVYCACYCEDLSSRDYSNFFVLFDILGVTNKIKYGPFNKICELIINQQGDVRKLVLDFIQNGFSKESSIVKETSKNPKILLVDEVDIFFTNEFYGSLYNPLARLCDVTIQKLASLIWQNRSKHISLAWIRETSEYQDCIKRFKKLNYIIDESIKDMITDAKNFSHEYQVINDKIAYKEQNSISFEVTYGYKTLFAYFHEYEQGRVSLKSLEENCFIGIRCGSFSYAEIPLRFEFIVGVSGTIKTLSEPEWYIIKNEYNINTFTIIPSVFGKNKLKFAEKNDIYVENSDDYFKVIRKQIDKNLTRNSQKRAVLVFFQSKKRLMDFYNSPEVQSIQQDIQIVTEELSHKEKNLLIKRSTTSGQITFLTASFGRGTDFKCRDQQVLNNGGVHVIQVFFSSKKSEEVQIQGRTTRQEADGSYDMVLLESDLEYLLGASYRDRIKEIRTTNDFYIQLDQSRTDLQKIEFYNNKKFIELIKKEHEKGQGFIQSVINQKEDLVQKFLQEQNKGANELTQQSKILILVDGTDSMGVLLKKAKNTVCKMFERACKIIRNNSIPDDQFKLQFAVYRDYDQMQEGILQSSPWESKAENLRKFLDQISPQGGGDYEEAIEVGLQHANYENYIQPISQIILIADAPAKSQTVIKEYRKKYGGEDYWQKSKFSQITHYKAEIEKLKNSKIPVHCFYLHKGAKNNFEEIATFTGGKCQELNINNPEGSDILTNIVVEPILQSVGQLNGRGNNLVEEYQKLFSKSYK